MRNIIALLSIIILCSCNRDIEMTDIGIRDSYTIARMSKLLLHPEIAGESFEWTLYNPEGGVARTSTLDSFVFMEADTGIWNLTLKTQDKSSDFSFDIVITVVPETNPYSPYISKVYEYCPAPGQFINKLPEYEEGDSYLDMLRKCEESICGTADLAVSLGAWGGYITFGFDHTVVNIEGEKDFRLWGNAVYAETAEGRKGGSCEPGIIMVSYDLNCNGIPDDEWYELAGSEYDSPSTVRLYSMTYFRPVDGKTPIPSADGTFSDTEYIRWTDTSGATGYLPKNIYHKNDYWPKWSDDKSLTFTGSRLNRNAVDISGDGHNFVLYPYAYGYADNHPNTDENLNSFDISTAVNSKGEKVNLPGIDFIRVYTAISQYCGWIGETSTEISRCQDLHINS